MGMEMNMNVPEDDTRRLAEREARGMRRDWSHVKGLTTVVRVLPPDLYDKVMHGQRAARAGLEHLRADPGTPENELKRPSSIAAVVSVQFDRYAGRQASRCQLARD